MRVFPASPTSPRGWRWLAAALMIGVCSFVQAQDQGPDDGGAGDPPARVARLSYRSGDVGLLPAGSQDWGDASLNRPLTTGDRLSTGQGSRAELELGGGTLRMADDSDFGFLTLDDQRTQVEVTKGTLNLAVRGLAEGQSYEIDTPTVALVVDQPGTFRVDISDNGKSTRVMALEGHATVYGENGAQRSVNAGRSYEFPDASLDNVVLSDVDGGDDFDAWCNSRDHRYERPQAGQYVSNDVVGYQDLDQYGNWQAEPDYGQVWYPSNVAADWAPYRNGHWAYIGPWGWTWVDDSPWGFAPYHYGRWAYMRGRWGWVPGPIAVRPVYAPALVAFVGGAGFGVSVGVGGAPVGWFPLGPGEVYNPWYHASRGYYTNVNITNIYVRGNRNVVINNINNHYNYFRGGRPMPNERYFNREAPHAFTAMSGRDFAEARNAQRHMVAVDPHRFASAAIMPRGAGVQPERASFAPPRAESARRLPPGGFQREVVARGTPAAPMSGRGPMNNRADNPRAFQGPSNVRMLNGPSADNRPGGAGRAGDRPGFDRSSPQERGAFAAPAVRQPAPSDNERPAMRPGELPSARFARPRGDMATGDRPAPADRPSPGNQPRPGVSYIPGAESDRAARNQPGPGTLPNPPRFERATEGQPAVQERARGAVNQDYSPRFQRDNAAARPVMQEPRPMQPPQPAQESARAPMNQESSPRFQRDNAVARPMPQEPRNVPQPRGFEPPQGGYQPPQRGYEPPRGNPQPQPQPHPAQNGGQHESSGHEDRRPPHKDDQH
ncbi:DUF6600 domain-containing protein [Dyella soli]|uniref:FecR protein domain-containing protein n=1 Tax=Dyella soli TaxID=522319 RepID=A0A4V2NL56_9GAMM|nr:FecR family protein [Dyella soli]TCI07088.1 hypothetical protein EZM97_31235 [Dyella soli]